MVWMYLLMAAIFALVAIITWRYPPKNINHLYGYRTPLAMKNQENWHFAQALMPAMFFRSAFYMLAGAALSFYFAFSARAEMIFFLALLLLSLLGEILYSENKLKRFDRQRS